MGKKNFWDSTVGGFAQQGLQGAIGAGMGLLLQKSNDRRQIRQQQKLQDMEITGQKQMADYNQKKQMEMWENTGYGAQKEQMKKAGLNPGLMYGMGGGGGQTVDIAPGQVTGGHASGNSGEAMGMGMMAAQMGLLKAQKENIEADTANKTADVPVKGATEKNLKADTENKYLQGEILQIAGSVSRQTINEQMKHWENLIKQEEANIKQTQLANNLSEKQLNDKVEMLKKQIATEAAKVAMINSDINRNKVLNKVSDAQWQTLIQDLWMDREKFSEEKMMNVWRRWAIQNGIAGDDSPDLVIPIIGSIKDLMGNKGSTQPIRGFHKR